MSRRQPVARVILAVAVVCAAWAVPPDQASAQGTGAAFAIDNAVTVRPEYDAQVIRVTVNIAFYSQGCPAGTSCTVPAADVAAIVAAIELYWNGFNYKCFKVVVKVTARTVQSQADVGPSEVDVGLDSTPMSGIISSVRAVDPTAQYLSDDPAARVIPQHDPSRPTTWAARSEFQAIWAHEFGHVLGLHDNYAQNNRQVLPGASQDLMFASRFGVVSQEMIDRVVRRSGQVDEQKMNCGWVIAPGSPVADGKKCGDADGDWVVNTHTDSGGITQSGKFVVTIDGTTLRGTYVWDARMSSPDGSWATWHGTGDASIVLQPDGSAEMSFHGGTTTITQKLGNGGTSSTTVPGFEGQMFIWQPADQQCR